MGSNKHNKNGAGAAAAWNLLLLLVLLDIGKCPQAAGKLS